MYQLSKTTSEVGLDYGMAYPLRVTPPGVVFHVLNRAARKRQLFVDPGDYEAFIRCLAFAYSRVPVRIFAYCVMPNHFHLVMAADADGHISRFMALLTSTHSKRWHAYQGSTGSGAVYQGRFKAFPVQADVYFYNVCRYVEGNALRAGLVTRAEHWPWSSARSDGRPSHVPLQIWPVPKPEDWIDLVNRQLPSVTTLVRNAIKAGTPLGDPAWAHQLFSTSEVNDL